MSANININLSLSLETIAEAQAFADGDISPATTDEILQAVVAAAKSLPVTFTMRGRNHVETSRISGARQALKSNPSVSLRETFAKRLSSNRKRQHHELDTDEETMEKVEATSYEQSEVDDDIASEEQDGETAVEDSRASCESQMVIRVIVVTFSDGELIVPAKPSMTVDELKHKVWEMGMMTLDEQRMICRGKQLEDGRTLEDVSKRFSSQWTILTLDLVLPQGRRPGPSCPASSGLVDRRAME